MRRAFTSTPRAVALHSPGLQKIRFSPRSSPLAAVRVMSSLEGAGTGGAARARTASSQTVANQHTSPLARTRALPSSDSIQPQALPSTVAPVPSSQVPALSQAEFDALVDGISFDDDLSFDIDTPTQPQPISAASAQITQCPSSALLFSPARSRSPSHLAPLASTSRTVAPLEIIKIGSSSPLRPTPPSSTRSYATRSFNSSSSARQRKGEHDAFDAPLPEAPPDDGYLAQLSAAIEREAGGSHAQEEDVDVEVLELSSGSDFEEVQIAPIRLPTRKGKENARSAETTTKALDAPAPLTRPTSQPRTTAASRVFASKATASAAPRARRAPYTRKPSESTLRKVAKQAELARLNPPFDYRSYDPAPRLVYTKDEVVVSSLLSQMSGPLGFDLEWEPYSYGGKQGKTALAQVCDEKTILLIHVAQMARFPPSLRALVEDPTRIKLGVQINGDSLKLVRDGFASSPKGMLDLNTVAKAVDPNHRAPGHFGLRGLQALVATYLERHLPKDHGVRTGKWAAGLGEEQKRYGANDVYSSLLVYKELESRAPEGVDFTQWGSGNTHATSTGTSKAGQPIGFTASGGALPSSTAAKVPKTPAARTEPTPRQMEAYKLWHTQGLSVAETTERMSATRPIKALSAVWSVLGALSNHEPQLEYDAERLLRAVDGVEGALKEGMLQEHKKVLDQARSKVKMA